MNYRAVLDHNEDHATVNRSLERTKFARLGMPRDWQPLDTVWPWIVCPPARNTRSSDLGPPRPLLDLLDRRQSSMLVGELIHRGRNSFTFSSEN